MSRKLKQWFLIFTVCISLFGANLTVLAVTEYVEGYLRYTVAEGSVTIIGYNGNESEVTVPAQIAGTPVNTIAAGAFCNSPAVTKINLPDTIMAVEEGAFGSEQTVIYSNHNNGSGDVGASDNNTNQEPEQGAAGESSQEPDQGIDEESSREPGQESSGSTNSKPTQGSSGEPNKKPGQGSSGGSNQKPSQEITEEETDWDTTGGSNTKPSQGTTHNPGSNEIEEVVEVPADTTLEEAAKAWEQDTVKQPDNSTSQNTNVTGNSQEETIPMEFGFEEAEVEFFEDTEEEETVKKAASDKTASEKTESVEEAKAGKDGSGEKMETTEAEAERTETTGMETEGTETTGTEVTGIETTAEEPAEAENSGNHPVVIAVVVILLVAAGIGGYVFYQKKNTEKK